VKPHSKGVFGITPPVSRISSHSPRRRSGPDLKFAHPISNQESVMVIIFFAFATFAFFATIVGLIADTVSRVGAFT